MDGNGTEGQETSTEAVVTDRARENPTPGRRMAESGGQKSQDKSADLFVRAPPLLKPFGATVQISLASDLRTRST